LTRSLTLYVGVDFIASRNDQLSVIAAESGNCMIEL